MLWNETLVVAQGSGSALTAAAAASCIPPAAKFTLPANYFAYVGKGLRIRAAGKISSLITTPGTARYDVRLGGTVVFDSLAILLDSVAAHVDVGWRLEIELSARVIGTSANLMGTGTWTSEDILGVPASAPNGVLSAFLPWNTAPAAGGNFDSTTSLTVDLFFTQTAATGSCQLLSYSVETVF